MPFKSVRLYCVALDDKLKSIFSNESELDKLIADEKFRPAGQMEISSCGFAPVFGRNTEAFSFSYDGNHYFRFVEENKLLPTSVVNQALLDEIDAKEEELGRPLKKAEKTTLKTALTNKMLAQAFSSRREMMVWVNSRYGFVGVSVTSAKRAENAITYLRKALGGSFPAKAFSPRCVIEDRLTSFVSRNELPEGFKLGYDCVLKSNDDTGATVRASKEDLTCGEIQSHIKAGKQITDLQLNLNDSVSFVLNNELTIKRIAIDDTFLSQNLPQSVEDKTQDMQSYFIVEASVLTVMVDRVTKAFDCDR